METFEVIKKRRSVREYTSEDISEDLLRKIIQAGAMAPSAHNKQPWQFIIVRDNKIQKELMLDGEWRGQLVKAPVVVAVCFDAKNPYGSIDAALASENIVIAASSEGIGSCVLTSYWPDKQEAKNYNEIKKILKVPDSLEVLLLITLGYPAENPETRKFKPFEELIHFDKYGRNRY